ncbi:major facilitator superfamily MFS_1 [Xylanimonas cellulosilytica DSM 15894]|uniref:Major facilitator superfamily MFS_1 n=1 Tax=Xylanimonas cellulosilytica (strain DSM 15894 / JCM 12276 / CECT 5975 / KCTC 9989 / LMG 20990 / NBRC 107835 / XIL07) TaxID=446471 RepID=D1BVK0_XYLCX|nr:OFA family MFS transporter [Xylanimonas cellulosilytica]ACZ31319.1 major facilitator superfamily MFS_1 [Xylanimonas cellulosilytica DSM 15894]
MSILSVLDKSRAVAPRDFNRWLIPPAALAVHLAIGEVYAFSVFKTALVDRFDASLTQIGVVFSIAIGMLGLSAAFGGTWVEKAGPRKAMVLAALCWGTGFVIGSIGVATNQLWLLYLGYGGIGGIGLGIGYVSPVSTLIKWFPDRPGMATGLAIMGFGGGALIASPLTSLLLESLAPNPVDAIIPALLIIAAIDVVVMLAGAATIRTPHPDWKPNGWTPPAAPRSALICTGNVTARNAIRTPQFWLLWVVLFCNITAGIGILEQAAPMVQDFFPGTAAAVAAGFVGVLSLCNMGGRFGWSTFSDVVGRKRMYMVYLGFGAIAYLALSQVGTSSIGLFVLFAAIILSFYGGGFATIPAYLKDMFGGLQVSAIHGRLLTAWSAAGIAGPLIVNSIADHQKAAGREGAELYSMSLLVMAGLLCVGFVANLLVRPVAQRWHEPVPTTAMADVALAGAVAPTAPGGGAVATLSRTRVAAPTTPQGLVGRAGAGVLPRVLWVVVVGGLGYGLVMTVIKAIALFS